MDYVECEILLDFWARLSSQEQKAIILRLREILARMRALTPPPGGGIWLV